MHLHSSRTAAWCVRGSLFPVRACGVWLPDLCAVWMYDFGAVWLHESCAVWSYDSCAMWLYDSCAVWVRCGYTTCVWCGYTTAVRCGYTTAVRCGHRGLFSVVRCGMVATLALLRHGSPNRPLWYLPGCTGCQGKATGRAVVAIWRGWSRRWPRWCGCGRCSSRFWGSRGRQGYWWSHGGLAAREASATGPAWETKTRVVGSGRARVIKVGLVTHLTPKNWDNSGHVTATVPYLKNNQLNQSFAFETSLQAMSDFYPM